MEELLRSETQCSDLTELALGWLQDFWIEPAGLFHVAYSQGDSLASAEDPNAATSVVIREVRENSLLGMDYVGKKLWSPVAKNTDRAAQVVASAPLKDALPLNTMGVLPLFSTTYLAEILFDQRDALSLPTYATACRSILCQVSRALMTVDANPTEAEELHPFLLFRAWRSIARLDELFTNARARGQVGIPKRFFDLADDKTVIAAVKARRKDSGRKFEPQSLYLPYGTDGWWKNDLLGAGELEGTGDEPGSPLLRWLMVLIEREATHVASRQVARSLGGSAPPVDPSALAFSLAIMSGMDERRHSYLVSQGLDVLFENCEDGMFHAAMPFSIDDKGRAIFVPSVEIAGVALKVALAHSQVSRSDGLDRALEATERMQARLSESYNAIRVRELGGTKRLLHGWSTDKAPSELRIDSWVVALTVSFLLWRLKLIKAVKKKRILVNYSWTPYEGCKPTWPQLGDPDEGDKDGPLKQLVLGACETEYDLRKKAPVFVLYGPPGTAKTSFVEALASRLKWDLVSLSPSDFISDQVDRIEQSSRRIFNDLTNLEGCVVLLDEMDSLLRDRDALDKKSSVSELEFVVPAFLPKLQRLRDYALRHRLVVCLATNYYENLDRAIIRGGRMDYHLLIPPMSMVARIDLFTNFVTSPKWKNAKGALTPKAKVAAEALFKSLPPLLVYREVEQVARYAETTWSDPSKFDPADAGAAIGMPSLGPDLYDTRRRKPTAFREVCTVIARVSEVQKGIRDSRLDLNPVTGRTGFDESSTEDAMNYLKQVVGSKLVLGDWLELAKHWDDCLAHPEKEHA